MRQAHNTFKAGLIALAVLIAAPVTEQLTNADLGSSAHADWEWDDNDEARRAARRTARRVANRHSDPVTVLPANCVVQIIGSVAYQNCGGVLYQSTTQNNQVVYVVANPAPQQIAIKNLPSGCKTKIVGNDTFFECGSTVYKSASQNGEIVYLQIN